jgi:hypothetical protein
LQRAISAATSVCEIAKMNGASGADTHVVTDPMDLEIALEVRRLPSRRWHHRAGILCIPR